MITAIALTMIFGSNQSKSTKEIDAILARIAKPLDDDWERIAKFGDAAFVRLYPIVKSSLVRPQNGTQDEIQRRSLSYLFDCATAKRTPEMSKLLSKATKWRKVWIYDWLATKGNPLPNRRLFETEFSAENSRMRYSAVKGLARIGDLRAIQFLGKELDGTKQTNEIQRAICWNLASTEHPTALTYVRHALHKGRTLPKLTERLKLPVGSGDKEVVLSTSKDAKGITWALIRWASLGAPDDLWIVHESNGKWVDPVFTGATSYWPYIYPAGGPVQDGFEKHEQEMKALIQGNGWVKRYLENPELAKDSDNDGYSDLVEAWLGLDPQNSDTDKDGILDGIDKNPFAGIPIFSDQEMAIQAAVSVLCMTNENPNRNQIISFPEGMTPFEIESTIGPVLVKSPATMGEIFGIRFRIQTDAKGITKDGSDFLLRIRESDGSYDCAWELRVKKLGTEWFVVKAAVRSFGSA